VEHAKKMSGVDRSEKLAHLMNHFVAKEADYLFSDMSKKQYFSFDGSQYTTNTYSGVSGHFMRNDGKDDSVGRTSLHGFTELEEYV
jgi:hypothetical protein